MTEVCHLILHYIKNELIKTWASIYKRLEMTGIIILGPHINYVMTMQKLFCGHKLLYHGHVLTNSWPQVFISWLHINYHMVMSYYLMNTH